MNGKGAVEGPEELKILSASAKVIIVNFQLHDVDKLLFFRDPIFLVN